MGDISESFSRVEFECQCACGFNTVDIWIVEALQAVRDEFGKTIVLSGCRCKSHNDTIKDSHPQSKHTEGCAADFRCNRGTPCQWMSHIKQKYPDRPYDFKLYHNRVHIEVDTR